MDLIAKARFLLTSIGVGAVVILAIRIVTQLVVLAREILITYKTTLEVRKLLQEETERAKSIITANEQELKRYRNQRPSNFDFELGSSPSSSSGGFEYDPKEWKRVQELEMMSRSAADRFHQQRERILDRLLDPTKVSKKRHITARADAILAGVSLFSLALLALSFAIKSAR
jgi:hypothetical protein